jgi:hypothetical protein
MQTTPTLTNWTSVPANVQTQIHDRVNLKSVEEQIPAVSYDLLSWRMARTIQYRTAIKIFVCSLERENNFCSR